MPTVRTQTANPLILIGDRLSPRPHLSNLIQKVRKANRKLTQGREIEYVICTDYPSFARALKQHAENVRLILVGPGIDGKQDTLARLLGNGTPVILAIDPESRPLAETREEALRLLENLRDLGRIMVRADLATEEFYEPLVRKHVVAGLGAGLDTESMTPEQRAEILDRRLETVTAFPSLPETQRRVSALNDEDAPKKWAEAIDPDIPIRTVIMNLLNSAHYSFRHRVETIEQAVSLASAR